MAFVLELNSVKNIFVRILKLFDEPLQNSRDKKKCSWNSQGNCMNDCAFLSTELLEHNGSENVDT